MPDVEITYNNSTIASLSDSGTEVLETSGTYLTDDITVQYTKSGGGGTTTVTAAADNSTYAYVDGDGVFQKIDAIPLPGVSTITMNVVSGSLITRYASSTTAVTITNATSQARTTSSSGTIRCVQFYVAD